MAAVVRRLADRWRTRREERDFRDYWAAEMTCTTCGPCCDPTAVEAP